MSYRKAQKTTLDQHIGVRIPGGQPKHSKYLSSHQTRAPNSATVVENVGTNLHPRGFPSLLNRLEPMIHDFLRQVRSEFASEIARDPKAFKTSVLRLVRKQLPPRRGRPNDPRIDAAVQMLQQGNTVKEVLRTQVPGFDQLDTYGRYLADKGLRTAIARRRKLTSNPHESN